MVADVAANMQTFFVPQMEQLGMQEKESRYGSYSTVESEWGHGILWAHSLSDNCLFTFHDLHLDSDISITEFTDDYICIASMTCHSAKMCPVDKTYFKERNTVTYEQEGQSGTSYELKAGERHRSFTFCLSPAFFDGLEGITDEEKESLVAYLASQEVNTHAPEVVRALESLEPEWAHKAGGDRFCRAKLNEILAVSLCEAVAQDADIHPAGTGEDRRLAREAQLIIDSRYAEPLTLQSIARELYVGKTRLCSVFKKEYGLCVAEYLRDKRIDRAKELLANTASSVSEIGSIVGYAHQSSFAEAFRRECGVTPTQWRNCPLR